MFAEPKGAKIWIWRPSGRTRLRSWKHRPTVYAVEPCQSIRLSNEINDSIYGVCGNDWVHGFALPVRAGGLTFLLSLEMGISQTRSKRRFK